MGKVTLDMSISLDGYAAGTNIRPDNPLGDNGESLHDWMFKGDSLDRQIGHEKFAGSGAVIIGRRMFDLGLEYWGDDGAFRLPCFVLTTRPREPLVKGPTTFTFVTDGIESALKQAQAAAGDKNVCIAGGANVCQQYLKAGLVDELDLHIAHVLLGGGERLFDHLTGTPPGLEKIQLIESPLATHLKFRVVK